MSPPVNKFHLIKGNHKMTTKQKIDQAEANRYEELSLAETLSLEEAVCDAAEPIFLAETADLPVDPTDLNSLNSNGDFDQYQFFNQNQIAGLDNEDLDDLTNPDHRGGVASLGDKDLSESALASSNASYAFGNDPDRDIAANDIPDMDTITKGAKTVDVGPGDQDQITNAPVKTDNVLGESANAVVASLLGEGSADNAIADDGSDLGDDDDNDEDDADLGDFDPYTIDVDALISGLSMGDEGSDD
jgi:hypothetical protein